MARDSGGLSNLSWGCQLERFVNFFPGACSLFVPLVSVYGITSFLVLPKIADSLLFDSLLFSVVPRCPGYASFTSAESSKKETNPSVSPLKIWMLDAHSTLFFPSQERSHESVSLWSWWAMLVSFMVLQSLWCCYKLLSSLWFSVMPRYSRYYGS